VCFGLHAWKQAGAQTLKGLWRAEVRHQSQAHGYSEAHGLLVTMVGQSEAHERRDPEEGFKACGGMTLEGETPREFRGTVGSARIRMSAGPLAGMKPRSRGRCCRAVLAPHQASDKRQVGSRRW